MGNNHKLEIIVVITKIAAVLIIANWIADKLTKTGSYELKVHEDPVKSKLLPW